MAPKIPKPRGWDAGRCQFIAETYLDWFLEYVDGEARRKDTDAGGHRLEDLRDLAERFRKSQRSAQALFQNSFFSCSQARLNSAWKDDRGDHLLRLLVEQIFPLLVEEGGPELERGGLSRRMLPGLFKAIIEIVGTRTLEDFDRQCVTIVERLRDGLGDDFEWDDFFDDAEARQVLIRILADLAHSFDDYARSREGFIGVVNKDYLGSEDGERPGVPEWRFDENRFATFARYFFVPLVEAMASGEERAGIASRFDDAALDQIENFLERAAEETP
jgi:hypothetical protein